MDEDPQRVANPFALILLCRRHSDRLSEWEQKFLRELFGFRYLSSLQLETLYEIARKLGVMDCRP